MSCATPIFDEPETISPNPVKPVINKLAVVVTLRLMGRKPALGPEERDLCRVMRERRLNGEPALTTAELALRFNVCEATIRNSARNLHAKHLEFVKRLVRLSAGLRAKP